MGIGGLRGLELDLRVEDNVSAIEALLNEELGIVIEMAPDDLDYVLKEYSKQGVRARRVGTTGKYGMESQVITLFLDVFSQKIKKKRILLRLSRRPSVNQ